MSNKGFAIKDTEKELEALEAAIKAEEEKLNPPAPKPEEEKAKGPEEETFKKRYSDLRSFAQKKENELKTRIEALERQLSESTDKTMKFPTTDADLDEWAKKYPDVYNRVVTIAKKSAIEVTAGLDEKVKAADKRDYDYIVQVAKDELTKAHPDFWELKDTEEFNAWLDVQPLYIYNALYENETDSLQAIRAVDLYKSDAGITKKVKKEEVDLKEFATQPVRGKSGAEKPAGETQLKYTESKVASMPWREQEKNIAEIEKCMENPAFYDISGGAR